MMSCWMRLVLFGIIILLTRGCEYEPQATLYTDIDPTQPPKEITLSCVESPHCDTILVSGIGQLKFKLELGEYVIYKAEVLLDSSRVSFAGPYLPADDINLNVRFSYQFMEDGYYSLKFKGYYETGALPIEDRILEQNNTIIREWVIHYTKKPSPPDITFFGAEEGTLKIEWDAIKSVPFDHYLVEVGEYNQNIGVYSFHNTAYRIHDPADTIFYDNQYIGNKQLYRVQVSVGGVLSDTFEMISSYSPEPKIYTDKNLNRIFSWEPTPFYNNFGHIEVHYDGDIILNTDDPSDTCFILKDGILKNRSYWFRVIPEQSSTYEYIYETRLEYQSLLDSFSVASYLEASPSEPYYIFGAGSIDGQHHVFRFNPFTGETRKQDLRKSNQMVISPNGRYLYTGRYIIDPNMLTRREYIVKNHFDLHQHPSHHGISNKGILCSTGADVYLSDLNIREPVGQLTSINGQYGAYISPNSEYVVWIGHFMYRFDLWKYDSTLNDYVRGSSRLLGDDWYQNLLFKNDSLKSDFYHLRHEKGKKFIEQWSCERALKIWKTETEADYLFCIDPVNGNIAAYSEGLLYIYDPLTGELLYNIALDPEFAGDYREIPNDKKITVVNSVVYTPMGKLDLKKYE